MDALKIGRIFGIDIRIHWSWLAIFFLLLWWLAEGFYDEVDSGDEEDANPKALRLPSGGYDIGLVIQDKLFDGAGFVMYDRFDHNGFLGDKQIVNGAIQPRLAVKRRKYRFRILTAANARWFELFLSSGQKFVHIATDGGLLPSPIYRESIRSATAERNEVIIDFSNYSIGDKIYLENRMEQTDGRGPIKVSKEATYQLLRFDVVGDAPDPSRVPAKLRELPKIDLATVDRRRTFEFERKHGGWVINDRFFDDNYIMADLPVGSTEIWTLKNGGGGWWHPIHIHLEYFRVLTRNGKVPEKWERAKKDVFQLPPNAEVEVLIKARTFRSRWVMHCHNLEHEDMAMMMNWKTS